MKVRFWGTRGSIAKPGPSTVRFGGNTSCVEVRSSSGTRIVLDCGTGAHALGRALMDSGHHPIAGHILITHTHWDHIQGIPFFDPLFETGNTWDIYAPRGLGPSLQESLAGQMQYTYFPVSLEKLGATIRYHDLVEGAFDIGDVRVYAHYMNHPALTLGYRLEADGVAIVYACDHEPHSRRYALATGTMSDQDRRHVDFMHAADLVIHDAQYTTAEYPHKIGWGHTPVACAIDMCRRAGAHRLALTHHDPLRDDDGIDRICATSTGGASPPERPMAVFAAAEGMEIELQAPRPAAKRRPPANGSAFDAARAALGSHAILMGIADDRLAEKIGQAVASEGLRVQKTAKSRIVPAIRASTGIALVILDGADALEICRAIRAMDHDGARQLPVIVVVDQEPGGPGDGCATDRLIHPFTREYARSRIHAWVMRSVCRWERASIPEDEARRIQSLNRLNILDTAAEERFDRITRIAAVAFDVPIALVTLIDKDRQWFKSHYGLDLLETSRDQAFCAHTILDEGLTIVPDALLDPRFADNPLVTGQPRIRFYAGYPLSLPDGTVPGTLCLIDTRPRYLDATKRGLLRDLGRLVELELAGAAPPPG